MWDKPAGKENEREHLCPFLPLTILSVPRALGDREALTPCLFPKSPASKIAMAPREVIWDSRLRERERESAHAHGHRPFSLQCFLLEREQTCPSHSLPSYFFPCGTHSGHPLAWQVWRVLVPWRRTGFSLPPLACFPNACFAHRESGGLAWARKRVW